MVIAVHVAVKTNRFWLFWALLFERMARWCDARACVVNVADKHQAEETFEEPFFG